MKYLISILTLLILSLNLSLADEAKIKTRGINNNEQLKRIDINLSPDLLKISEFEKLKYDYKTAKNFAFTKDKNLEKRKKIKYRGSAKQIYKNYSKSVFFLLNTEGEGIVGTGFLVDKSGLVLSNWHVTDGAKQMFVWTLPEEGALDAQILFKEINPYYGQVVAENKLEDLALIKVSGLPSSIIPVELGSNQEVDIGDNVYAIGHPKSLPWTFSSGMVSQIREKHKWMYVDKSEHQATVIQMQTPISTGNSGGPLFTSEGKVVGVNTLMQGEGQNLNFAVAVDHVKKFIKENPNVKKVNPAGALVKKNFPNATAQDYNKNGIIDTGYVDTNKNGKIDTAFIDDDEDGFVEGTLIDKNENGVWELMVLDTDKDGKNNEAYIDEDEDRKADVLAHDYDQDGNWDKFEKLS